MYQLLYNIIGYSGGQLNTNTVEQYCLYGAIVITIILTVIFIDLIWKIFRAFLPRNWR